MSSNKTIEQRFWSKTRPRRNGCIEWLGYKNKKGYGQFQRKGEKILAHRMAWILTNGEIPEGEGFHGTCVLHKCDNPSCVNPDHLFLGTNYENILDMYSKSRNVNPTGKMNGMFNKGYLCPNRKGNLNTNSKLSENDVIEIRKLHVSHNYTHSNLANLFKISKSQITSILLRRSWSHV